MGFRSAMNAAVLLAAWLSAAAATAPDIIFRPTAFDANLPEGPHMPLNVMLTTRPSEDVTVSWHVHDGPVDITPSEIVFTNATDGRLKKTVWLRRHRWIGFWWGADMPVNITTNVTTDDTDYAPLAAGVNVTFPVNLTEMDPPPVDGIDMKVLSNPSEDGTLGALELKLKTEPLYRNYTNFSHYPVGVWVYMKVNDSTEAEVVVPAAPDAPRTPEDGYKVAAYFPPGDWQTPQTAYIRGVDDTKSIGDGDVPVHVHAVWDSPDTRHQNFAGHEFVVRNIDDDDHHYHNCSDLAGGVGLRCASIHSQGEVCNALTLGDCQACCEARNKAGCCEWRGAAADVDTKPLSEADMCYFHLGAGGPGWEGVVAAGTNDAHAAVCRKFISTTPERDCVGADYLPAQVAVTSTFSLTLYCRHHTDHAEAVYLAPEIGVCDEGAAVFVGEDGLETVMTKLEDDRGLIPRFRFPGVFEPGDYQVCLKKLSDNTSLPLHPPLTVLPGTTLDPYVMLQEGIASGGEYSYDITAVGDASGMRFGLSRHHLCHEPELLGLNDTSSSLYSHDGRTVVTRRHYFDAPGRYWSCVLEHEDARWRAHAAFNVHPEANVFRTVSTVPEFPRAKQGFRLVLFGESLGNLTANETQDACKVSRIDPTLTPAPACQDSNLTSASWELFDDKTIVCDFSDGVEVSGWYHGCFSDASNSDATFMVRERNVSRVYATSIPAVPTTRDFFTVLVRGEREWQDSGVLKITDDVTCESDHWIGAWNSTRTTNNYAHIHKFQGPTVLVPPFTEMAGHASPVPTADNLCVQDRKEEGFNFTGAPFSMLYACPIAQLETEWQGFKRLEGVNVNQHHGYTPCGHSGKGWGGDPLMAFAVTVHTKTEAECTQTLFGNYTGDGSAWGECEIAVCRAELTSCFKDGAPAAVNTSNIVDAPLCGFESGYTLMGLGECLTEYAFVTRVLVPVPYQHSCLRLHGRYLKSRAACLLDVCDSRHLPNNWHSAFDLPDAMDGAPMAPAHSTPPAMQYSPVWVSDPITVNLPGYPIFACFRAKHERLWRWLGGFATEDSCAVKRAKLCREVRCTDDETVVGQCWLEGDAWGGLGSLRGPANFVRSVCEQMVCAEEGGVGKQPMPVYFEQELPLLRHPAFTVSPDGSEVRVHYSAHAHNLALIDPEEEVYIMTNPLPLELDSSVTFSFQFQNFSARETRIGLLPLAQTDSDPMGPGPVYNSTALPLVFETPFNSTVVHDIWTPDHNCTLDGDAWYRFRLTLAPPEMGIYLETANGTATTPTCVPLDPLSLLEFHDTGWRVAFVMKPADDGILPLTDMARLHMRP